MLRSIQVAAGAVRAVPAPSRESTPAEYLTRASELRPGPRRASAPPRAALPLVLVSIACCTAPHRVRRRWRRSVRARRRCLNETFKSHRPIESGRIALSFALAPVGTIGFSPAKAPLSLHLEGPFQSAGDRAQLPHFALQAELQLGQACWAAAGRRCASGPSRPAAAVRRAGRHALPRARRAPSRRSQQGYAAGEPLRRRRAGRLDVRRARRRSGRLAHAPVDRRARPTSPATDTVHIVAGLNASAHFFADASRLSQAGGSFAPEQLERRRRAVRAPARRPRSRARCAPRGWTSTPALRTTSCVTPVGAGGPRRDPELDRGALGGLRAAALTLELQFAAAEPAARRSSRRATRSRSPSCPVLDSVSRDAPA